MVRYAITSGTHGEGAERVLEQARRWAAEGVEYVQLREPHLNAGEQARLAKAIAAVFREAGGGTSLLVNHRVDVAVAAGAGVHLTARVGELTAAQVRQVFGDGPVRCISVSCHTLEDVRRAATEEVDLILFGPVLEKRVAGELAVAGVGLEMLGAACAIAGPTGVLALGGVTAGNAAECIEAGAAGVAGIRFFERS